MQTPAANKLLNTIVVPRALLALSLLSVLWLALVGSVGAEETTKTDDEKIVFVPPPLGAPADRVPAGTRSAPIRADAIALLSPGGGGLTANPQPTLYWHLPRSFRGTLELLVTEAASNRRVADRSANVDLPKGLHALSFSQINVMLSPGGIYRLTVKLTSGQFGPVQASTLIEVTDLALSPEETIASLARKGLWFDAVDVGMQASFSGLAKIADESAMRQLFRSAGVAAPWTE